MRDVGIVSFAIEYTRVTFDSRETMLKAVVWCNTEHVSDGRYARGGRSIFFEDSEDAVACTLRWL